jgi:predicted PurR-regulated permease PerM
MTNSAQEDSSIETKRAAKDVGSRVAVRVALYCVAILSVLFTLHYTRSLLMPFVVALFVALLLSPLVSWFRHRHIPRPIASIFLLALLGVPFVFLIVELAEPAQKWMGKLPELTTQLTEGLTDISETLTIEEPRAVAAVPERETGFSFSRFFQGDDAEVIEPEPVPVAESALIEGVKKGGIEILLSILGVAPSIVAQWAIWLILVLFLLIYGPGLYDNFINLFPLIRDKRRAVLLVGRLRQELSRYIITVTIINAGLGLVTGAVLWALGVEDAILWGALVALLNYAPYVGPFISICILGVAGLAQYGLVPSALLPATVFFSANLLESQFVTPTVLGNNMRLNPLILILWLLIWGWLWGPVGLLIAVPLLVCLKLVASHVQALNFLVDLIETRS